MTRSILAGAVLLLQLALTDLALARAGGDSSSFGGGEGGGGGGFSGGGSSGSGSGEAAPIIVAILFAYFAPDAIEAARGAADPKSCQGASSGPARASGRRSRSSPTSCARRSRSRWSQAVWQARKTASPSA